MEKKLRFNFKFFISIWIGKDFFHLPNEVCIINVYVRKPNEVGIYMGIFVIYLNIDIN